MPSSKLGKTELQGPSPPSESLKCNNRDGTGTWNVEKLVGMCVTGSGLINCNYFGRGHRGCMESGHGVYQVLYSIGSREAGRGRDRLGHNQLIKSIYLGAGGTIES